MVKRVKKPTQRDKILWEKVTHTVTPYDVVSRDLEDFLNQDLAANSEHISPPKQNVLKTDTSLKSRIWAEPYTPPISKPNNSLKTKKAYKKTKALELNPIERPVKKKISRGRVGLESRLDLHGMTQQDAYIALYDYLAGAYTRGERHVLVITGKGTSSGGNGILRQAVPKWLNQAQFKMLVSGYDVSARNHGGEGALYVRLRKKSVRGK